MKVEKIALHYPNGQTMMELNQIEGSVEDITKVAAAGLNDVISKMPEMTKHIKDILAAYEEAKSKGVNVSSQQI